MWRRARPCAQIVVIAAFVALPACGREPQREAAAPASAPVTARGQPLYEIRCAPCHGVGGGGDGPAAAGIDPKPRNFRDPAFWKGRSAEQLRLVVRQGRPGSLMPPFEGLLSDAEIDDVVAYVQSFRPAGS
jgi:mono/diheme cytochrome c family protein